MKIGIINIEPKIFNTAYMQIASYHRARGDTVDWWNPDNHFDKVYCSSIFDFTDKAGVPKEAICGGTGFDVKSRLPKEIEDCSFDYSTYPDCITSYVWFSRGCSRNCPYCCVRQKEGDFHLVKRKQLNTWGRYTTIMDNDFFANPNWRDVISWLGKHPVDIQNIDARTLTEEKCKALNRLRRWKRKQFRVAWDNPKENLVPKLTKIVKWLKPDSLMCYVLIGYWSTEAEDLHRTETLRNLGVDPFVMPYNKKDLYQKAFARWVNIKSIFKKVKWEDYRDRILAQEAAGTGWSK